MFALFLLCGWLGAQQDVTIGLIGPYADFARGAVWGSAGFGNVQNAYIFPPLTPQSQTCVYIANNNPTSAHAFTITFLYSGDPTISHYYTAGTTGQGHWKIVQVITDTVIASGINNYSFSSPGAARAAVLITATSTQAGSPDTADIYVVQTTTNCGTATVNVNSSAICNMSANTQVATATQGQVVAAPPVGQFVHVCAYSVTGTVSSTAETPFANGTAGTCTVLGATIWDLASATGNTGPTLSGGPSQLFQTTVPSQPLCFKNFGTGAISYVSVSYFIG